MKQREEMMYKNREKAAEKLNERQDREAFYERGNTLNLKCS